MTRRRSTCGVPIVLTALSVLTAPLAAADNSRLNNGVIANVYTIQQQAGCTSDIRSTPALRLAAGWHARDLINNRSLGGDLGSDGSTPQGRASTAGFTGTVVQIVAINPALAINNVDVINQWYHDPRTFAIMSDCRYTLIGVSSENSLDRSVVVAVLGQPS